mmetsp:Transcript_47628/g.93614  ORF Transcript_47628/g.93614 Transcript_47628/m.93614 type:complete len:220 (-) Transcript_47628:1980-2639(-)
MTMALKQMNHNPLLSMASKLRRRDNSDAFDWLFRIQPKINRHVHSTAIMVCLLKSIPRRFLCFPLDLEQANSLPSCTRHASPTIEKPTVLITKATESGSLQPELTRYNTAKSVRWVHLQWTVVLLIGTVTQPFDDHTLSILFHQVQFEKTTDFWHVVLLPLLGKMGKLKEISLPLPLWLVTATSLQPLIIVMLVMSPTPVSSSGRLLLFWIRHFLTSSV